LISFLVAGCSSGAARDGATPSLPVAFVVSVNGVVADGRQVHVAPAESNAITVDMMVPDKSMVTNLYFGIGGLSGWGGSSSAGLTGVEVLFHARQSFPAGDYHFALQWTPPRGQGEYNLITSYQPHAPPGSAYGSGGYTARAIALLSVV
jgi:hypothetical protein